MKTSAAGDGSSPYSARYTRLTASRIAAALAQRDTLWNESARSTISATAGGTSGWTDPRGRAVRVAEKTICSWGDVAGCTAPPVASANIVAPSAQTSVSPSISAISPAPARAP